jgi:hypothetical protein
MYGIRNPLTTETNKAAFLVDFVIFSLIEFFSHCRIYFIFTCMILCH